MSSWRWNWAMAAWVWLGTLGMVLLFVLIMTWTHNDQAREIAKINACKSTVDVGACITIAAAAGK